jgi:RNA polymerase sigma factor (sigma-70 family)
VKDSHGTSTILTVSDDDLTLLGRWRDGDKAAGETLVRRHYRAIFGRLRKALGGNADLAAELTQQVFLIVVTNREDIVTDFGRYLHGSVRFKLWEHFRRQSPSVAEPSQLADPGHGAFSVLIGHEDASLLVEALQSLSVEEQAYLMWYFADRLTQSAIAQRVGLSASQVNGRIHRAKDKLRLRLEQLSCTPSQRGSLDKGFDTWVMSLRRRMGDQS